MARRQNFMHEESPTGNTTDYLMQLRMNETSAATTPVDALGTRNMTVMGGTAGVWPAAMANDSVAGSRLFNGTTNMVGRPTADGDQTIFQSANGGSGVALWCSPFPSFAGDRTMIELGEWSSPAAAASNVQVALRVKSDGSFYVTWNYTLFGVQTGTLTSPTGLITIGTSGAWSHIGVRMQPDPDNILQMQVDLFHNGKNVARAKNVAWPTDGSSARWIVGASRQLGTAVGTYGSFFPGALDDIIVTKFPPDVAWFRKLYDDGVRDFEVRENLPGAGGYDSRVWATHCRVLVQAPITNPSGTTPVYGFSNLEKTDIEWVNLCSIDGNDFVDSVSWGDSVDDFVSTARVRLFRNFSFYNTSPFAKSSNPFYESSSHLLRSMRRVRIETAVVPNGMSRSNLSSQWEVMFDGFLRAIDVDDDFVSLTLSDLGCALLDVFIEPNKDGTDRTYGTSGGTAIEGQLSQIITDNDPARYDIINIDDNGASFAIVVTLMSLTVTSTDVNGRGKPHHFNAGDTIVISGTTNYNTPAGSVDTIASVSSTAITLSRTTAGAFAAETVGQVRGASAYSYKGGVPSIWSPVSSSWTVFQWNEPASKGVIQSLDDIMTQIGWRVRYKWDEIRTQFRLTSYNPSSGSSVFRGDDGIVVFGVMGISRLSTKIDDVRNTWVVEYPDNTNKDPRANRKIYLVSAINKTSIRDYGRKYARIRVASDSLISRSTEAQSMANQALRDMSDPIAEMQVDTLYDRRAQVQDFVEVDFEEYVTPNQMPQFFDADVKGACISVQHTLSRSQQITQLMLRRVDSVATYPISGGPVSRVERYDDLISQTGAVPGRGLSPPASALAPTVQNLGLLNAVRAARVSWSVPGGDLNRNYLETEVHQSVTINFTPSSATLAVVIRGTHAILTGMVLGTTYYVKVVHCDRMGNRSVESPQTTYVS